MATVTWALSAQRDLREAVQFIAQDSSVYAVSTGERIWDAATRLRDFPTLGRIIPEFGEPSLRELIVGSYRLMYRVRRRQVVIVAVVHARRDLEQHRRQAPWDMP